MRSSVSSSMPSTGDGIASERVTRAGDGSGSARVAGVAGFPARIAASAARADRPGRSRARLSGIFASPAPACCSVFGIAALRLHCPGSRSAHACQPRLRVGIAGLARHPRRSRRPANPRPPRPAHPRAEAEPARRQPGPGASERRVRLARSSFVPSLPPEGCSEGARGGRRRIFSTAFCRPETSSASTWTRVCGADDLHVRDESAVRRHAESPRHSRARATRGWRALGSGRQLSGLSSSGQITESKSCSGMGSGSLGAAPGNAVLSFPLRTRTCLPWASKRAAPSEAATLTFPLGDTDTAKPRGAHVGRARV